MTSPPPTSARSQRFHSSLASLAEIVAFTMLGLTMRLSELASKSAWADGLALAVLLTFVIRPVLGGLVLLPVRLTVRERIFFLWTGLKGAVPILLGLAILDSGTAGATQAYQVIFVIVGFSVTVQGGLVPTLAHRLRIPLRTVEPEPWSLGVRFSEEPEGLHRYHVAAGATADGSAVADLPCGENAWVSLVIRDGALLTGGGRHHHAGRRRRPRPRRPRRNPGPRALFHRPRGCQASRKPPVGARSLAAGRSFELIVCRWGARVTALMHERVPFGSPAAPNSHAHPISGRTHNP